MTFFRIPAALVLALLLGGCVFGGGGDDRRAPAPTIRERPGGPVTLTAPPSRETQQCFTDLARADIRFSPLPDRDHGSGCLVVGAVQLLDIGTPVTGIKALRCPLARGFVAWVTYGVRPAARQILGSDVVRVETMGTYSCRGIVGAGSSAAGRVSQHGLANAVDVSGFVLADGRRITLVRDWQSNDPQVREFLRTVHRSACKRFRTVLGPDYNAAHRDHFHFDMGRGPFCR